MKEANPMYAVVNTGGKQYKVQQGEILRVEKISGDVGSPVTFDRVLMFSDGETVSIGQPVLEDVAVEGHIVEQGKAKKIIVFKYKRRKRYRRKQGHRQQFTAVLIDSIGSRQPEAKETPKKADEPKPEVEKVETKPEAKKVEAKEAAPKKETAKKTEAKQAAPKETETQKASAEETVTEKPESKAAAKETEAKKAAPKETETKTAAPEETVTEKPESKTAAKKTEAKQSAPKETETKKAAPEETGAEKPESKTVATKKAVPQEKAEE
jgi:large subunit ribosomal protein L21